LNVREYQMLKHLWQQKGIYMQHYSFNKLNLDLWHSNQKILIRKIFIRKDNIKKIYESINY